MSFRLLLEDGSRLLKEDGSSLLLEGEIFVGPDIVFIARAGELLWSAEPGLSLWRASVERRADVLRISTADLLVTEDGDFIVTETGDFLEAG